MKYLLDTHVLLWAASQPDRLSNAARALIDSRDNELHFSAASIWEVVIKNGLGRNVLLPECLGAFEFGLCEF